MPEFFERKEKKKAVSVKPIHELEKEVRKNEEKQNKHPADHC